MAELSMNETTTFRWSFEEDVAAYADAGIPAMGVWRQKLSDRGPSRAVELLAGRGVKVSHLLWAGGFTGSRPGAGFTSQRDDGLHRANHDAVLATDALLGVDGGHDVLQLDGVHRTFGNTGSTSDTVLSNDPDFQRAPRHGQFAWPTASFDLFFFRFVVLRFRIPTP